MLLEADIFVGFFEAMNKILFIFIRVVEDIHHDMIYTKIQHKAYPSHFSYSSPNRQNYSIPIPLPWFEFPPSLPYGTHRLKSDT